MADNDDLDYRLHSIVKKYESGRINGLAYHIGENSLSTLEEFKLLNAATYVPSDDAIAAMGDDPLADCFNFRFLAKKLQELGTPWGPQFQQRGTCFPAKTSITMADETKKPIEEVLPGDHIISHMGVPRKVVRVFTRKYTGDLHTIAFPTPGWESAALSMTADHELAAFQKKNQEAYDRRNPIWVRADRFEVDDFVFVRQKDGLGACIPIGQIRRRPVENLPVFDFEVEVDHSFHAGAAGIVSKNCVGQGSKTYQDDAMALDDVEGRRPWEGRACVAWNYAGGRVEIANQPARWDGSNSDWSSEFLVKFGVLLMKELGLSENDLDGDEALAVNWALSRQGVPANYEALGKQRMLFKSWTTVRDIDELHRYLQSGHDVLNDSSTWASGKRDADGFSPVSPQQGGHCQVHRAGRITKRRGYLNQNSWGPSWASGGVFPDDQPASSVWESAEAVQARCKAGGCIVLFPTEEPAPRDLDYRFFRKKSAVIG